MKRKIFIALALIFFVATTSVFALAGDYGNIKSAELQAMMEQPEGLTIIDIRDSDYYKRGHIPTAINMPYSTAHKKVLKELKKDDRIVVVCYAGVSSREIAELLADNNFKTVYSLIGGMNAWFGDIER